MQYIGCLWSWESVVKTMYFPPTVLAVCRQSSLTSRPSSYFRVALQRALRQKGKAASSGRKGLVSPGVATIFLNWERERERDSSPRASPERRNSKRKQA